MAEVQVAASRAIAMPIASDSGKQNCVVSGTSNGYRSTPRSSISGYCMVHELSMPLPHFCNHSPHWLLLVCIPQHLILFLPQHHCQTHYRSAFAAKIRFGWVRVSTWDSGCKCIMFKLHPLEISLVTGRTCQIGHPPTLHTSFFSSAPKVVRYLIDFPRSSVSCALHRR